jgi:rsbT co-antagonist protein RsbR
MLLLLATFIFLIVETALATFVATHAWKYLPAKLFVLLVICTAFLNISGFIQYTAADAWIAYISTVSSGLALIGLQVLLLLIAVQLFMPSWWQGRRPPIFWISLPYVGVFLILLVDSVARLHLLLGDMVLSQGFYKLSPALPGGIFLLSLFGASWFVHFILLGVVIIRRPQVRLVSGALLGALLIALVINQLAGNLDNPYLSLVAGPISTVLLLAVLTYAVLRTRLFVPTQAALDLALQAMDEVVAVLDQEDRIIYTNRQALQLGLRTDQSLTAALQSAGAAMPALARLVDHAGRHQHEPTVQKLMLSARCFVLTLAPVVNRYGQSRGTLLLGRDVTEVEQYTRQLEQERQQLVEAITQLEAEQYERAQLAATVRALSLPLIPVVRGVLILPLIGEFDTARIEDFIRVLLCGIAREKARLVFIDITGLLVIDSDGAAGLLQGVQAATLLGARCVLIGVRPEIAEALVALGISLDGMTTAATLEQAMRRELAVRGLS